MSFRIRFVLCLLVLILFKSQPREIAAQTEVKISSGTKALPLPGESFKLNGHDAFIIAPPNPKPNTNTPWVWYAPTLNGLPQKAEVWMFERFLAEGIAIAGIDAGESYGSPKGCDAYSALFQYLTESRKFSTKPVLLARSRGGLMLYLSLIHI